MLGRIKQTDLTVPVRRAGYLYYSRTEEGKQYPIQCRRKGSMDAPEEVLLDPNELAEDARVRRHRQLRGERRFESAGLHRRFHRLPAVHAARQGSDARAKRCPIRPSASPRVAWAADNRTLFLTTEDETTKRSDKLWRHCLGDAALDALYNEEDELYDIGVDKTRDRKMIVLGIESKDTTECRYLRADQPDGEFAVFLPREKAHRYYIDHRESEFFIRTNKGGRNFEVKTRAGERSSVRKIGRRSSRTTTTCASRISICSAISPWWSNGPRPSTGCVSTISHRRNGPAKSRSPSRCMRHRRPARRTMIPPRTATTIKASSRRRASTITTCTPRNPRCSSNRKFWADTTRRKYASERLWATARDGVKVPISIVYKKGFERDGTRPLFLYAYGSYGYGTPAAFSSNRFSLLDRGMAYAIAHIRGGDEMGEKWREDGMLMKKRNTFNDFIDCAEYLIAHKWTSNDRLAIEGGSAGGLLMGAVANMRPDLFRAVHLAVPFVDVMNTMMDATLPSHDRRISGVGQPQRKSRVRLHEDV